MRYYCTICEKDVEICPHKTNIEIEHLKAKAEQFRKFAAMWEKKYMALKQKVRECVSCGID